jgi:hypothetical protein
MRYLALRSARVTGRIGHTRLALEVQGDQEQGPQSLPSFIQGDDGKWTTIMTNNHRRKQ